MNLRALLLLSCLLAGAQADTLILKDGTKLTGRWWSVDADQVHFLVDNQLQHYSRAEVTAVTFGDATLPPPPAPTQPAPAPTPAPAPDRSAPPQQRAPTLTRPAESAPQQAPSPSRAAAPRRTVSQPEEIGAVYYWNGKDLTPLERSRAVERKSGSATYWEIAGPRSSVRIPAADMAFIVRLPKGLDPAGYSLFPLTTANDNRQTQTQPGRRGGLLTWPFKIEINNESGYMTYAFKVTDLPPGEYSFSPSGSNDSYSFGVD